MGLDLREVDLGPWIKGWYQAGLRLLFQPSRPTPGQDRTEADSRPSWPDSLPEPWARIVADRKPSCTSIWTYWELPLDLGPTPDHERSHLFQNIIRALQWPKEDIVFWPHSFLDAGDRLRSRTDLFFAGLRHFSPRYALCFGREAIGRLLPGTPVSYGLFKQKEITYILLPGPEEMLPDNKPAKRIVWNTLKEL